jgi:MFS family permease
LIGSRRELGSGRTQADAVTGDAGRRSRTLAILIPLGIANHTILSGSRVIVSLDALSLGASPFTVGVLMALFAVLPMLFAVAVGRLSDRIGHRRPMLIGSVGLALGAALPVLWRGLPALFVSALLLGLSFMVFQLATQRATGEIGSPTERPRNFSLLALGYSVSGFIGPLVAGFSIDHFGHAAAFAVLVAVSAVPIAILGSGRFPLPGPHVATRSAHHGGVRTLLRHRTLRHVLAINTLLSSGWDLHMVFVPIYGASIGLTASGIGMVLAAFASATFVIRFLTPVIMRRRTERQVLTWALLVGGVSYLAFPYAQSVATLCALSFVLGLGLGSGQPMVMSLLHAHAPADRIGEAVGVRMSLIQTSSVAVPLLFGAVGTSLGLTPVFWLMGACLASGGLLARRREHG